MVLILLALLAASPPRQKPLSPVELHRTETEREGSAPFDLAPNDLRGAEIKGCLVEETIPMGGGIAEKRRCPGGVEPEPPGRGGRAGAGRTRCPPAAAGERSAPQCRGGRLRSPAARPAASPDGGARGR